MMKQGYIPPPQEQSPVQRNYRSQPAPRQAAPAYQQPRQAKAKSGRNILLLISAIMGTAYAAWLIIYFFGVAKQSLAPGSVDFEETGKQIGGALATILVTPHIIIVSIAAIFNLLGWYLNKGWAALTAGILYLVGGVLFFIYLPYVLIQAVLAFIGFSKISDKRKQAQLNYQVQ